MNLTLSREQLLEPLQQVIGVVERKQTLRILANVLLQVEEDRLALIGTDLEIELVSQVKLDKPVKQAFQATLQARKLYEIVRSMAENAKLEIYHDKERVILRSGRSRFTLAALPVADFPRLQVESFDHRLKLEAKTLATLLQRSGFAMAQQDVRYYLNGLFLHFNDNQALAVATDGHRLALTAMPLTWPHEEKELIVPRKTVLELLRLLPKTEVTVELAFTDHYLCVIMEGLTLTSKLIDGRFPNYRKLINYEGDKVIALDREALRQALQRTSILCNEKFRGIRLQLRKGLLNVSANNPEQEEAEEILQVAYEGAELDVGFNVNYLIEALTVLEQEKVKLTFKDENTSLLIEEADAQQQHLSLVMPVKLI